MQSNPGLRHLLQQQQFRPQMMMQMQQPNPGQRMPQPNIQQPQQQGQQQQNTGSQFDNLSLLDLL
jgi:hypothetical protein